MLAVTQAAVVLDRPQRVEVDLVAETVGERVGGPLGVVPGPIESPVDSALDDPPDGLEQGEGLLLRPASSIHTFFMRFPIDAVFLARDMTVLRVVSNLAPWRMASKFRAHAVLELAAGTCERRGVRVGDRLTLAT